MDTNIFIGIEYDWAPEAINAYFTEKLLIIVTWLLNRSISCPEL